jgi:predicted Ser/Thr protein kinase
MTSSPRTELADLLDDARAHFSQLRRALSFDEFVDLFAEAPTRMARDASRYLRDMFDFYGTTGVERPYGRATRWKLFDLPWEDEAGRRDALVGHERLQDEVYRALSTFARQGRVNRLVLLHGPNGSAKSTFVACMMRAMEHYSTTDDGALYRFHWVFPRGRGAETRIGFGGKSTGDEGPRPGESYAHLEEMQLEAKILCEVRDHPLLVLPTATRQRFLGKHFGRDDAPPDHLFRGGLCHKCQQIFEALLSAYRGDLGKVLAHVQVERWNISRKYRNGASTIGPQMAVDAKERQVTASRSLAALPASLQNVTLFEPFGELVDAAGGLLEYSDLLKRPLEAWKYLLIMIETGEIALTTANLTPNVVLVGSSNEVHLDAFREHPEFPSFRGRLELVRAPYLLDWTLEKTIYDHQVLPGVRRHVAPHTTELAALFAVLSRMRKPSPDRFGRPLASLAGELSPLEKADLYATGAIPQRLSGEQAKELHAGIEALYLESDIYPNYEGRVGASPREVRALLLDAAQHPGYKCLSPFGTLEEITELCTRRTEFEWLRQDSLAGGYHDPRYMLKVLRDRLLDHCEDEFRSATGLVDETRYRDSFDRYVIHVNSWVKGEKLRNKMTGKDESPDEAMMREIERTLAISGTPEEFRKNIISLIAAYAIDHPGTKVDYVGLFPRYLQKLKEAFFAERRKQVVALARHLVVLIADEGGGLDAEQRAHAEATLVALKDRFGYCDSCARDAAAALLKERFADVRL